MKLENSVLKGVLRTAVFLLHLLFFGSLPHTLLSNPQNQKPNVLWVSCEDITTMLGAYGDPNAHTPHLDAFAKRSVLFTNAFATAPVCSPARSCIITGNYATSLGTQHLRSEADIPEFIKPFPKYLSEAGYYVTNNGKEDYNFIDTTIWDSSTDQSHWRDRGAGQPFFSVFNLLLTHQSSIFGSDSVYENRIKSFLPHIVRCDPDKLILPDYYPDSPTVRKLWARYYTNVSIIDYQFGQILKNLHDDGLEDETIVVFFSDHGTGMPRSKRALYDSGLKIPLIVSVPDQWAADYQLMPGTTNDAMVSFIDFAPTMLDIANIPIPSDWLGSSFLKSKETERTSYTFGTSDRVDEAYELSRTIRTDQYRYIRNYLPHYPLLQSNYYTDQSEIMQELDRYRQHQELTPAQQTMFTTRRMPEELYDVKNDPDQTNNLAYLEQYATEITAMRKRLRGEVLKSFDTGFMPEPEMIQLSSGTTSFEVAHSEEVFPLKAILDACDLMLAPDALNENLVLEMLQHPNGFVRYWALIAIEARSFFPKKVITQLQLMLKDDFATIQVEAAKVLIKNGQGQHVKILIAHIGADDLPMRLYAARAFQEVAPGLKKLPREIATVCDQMELDTNGGDLNSNYYKLYTYWSLKETFQP